VEHSYKREEERVAVRKPLVSDQHRRDKKCIRGILIHNAIVQHGYEVKHVEKWQLEVYGSRI
jgi:hypothetical protein